MAIQEALSKRSQGDQLSKQKAPRCSGGRGTGGCGRGGCGNYQYRGGSSGYSGCYQSYGGHGGNYYAPKHSLALQKDVAPLDDKLLKVLQVVVVDKVVVFIILQVAPTMLPVLSGDGVTILPAAIGDIMVKVKAVADLLFILYIMRTSTVKAKKILTKDTKNSIMPMGKNSTATWNKNRIMRKDRWTIKSSTMRKPENRKKSSLRTPIGLMSSESDKRS